MFTFKIDEELSLKLLEKYDAEPLFDEVDASREYLSPWLPWVDNMKQYTDYHPVIEIWQKQFAENDGFQVGIVCQGSLVGMIGYHAIDWNNKKTSIGYWLSEKYQGHGIMTRCVKALFDYAFNYYSLNRVEIGCSTKNLKSRAIPERLGMVHEGTIRANELLQGTYADTELYSMLADEWKNRDK